MKGVVALVALTSVYGVVISGSSRGKGHVASNGHSSTTNGGNDDNDGNDNTNHGSSTNSIGSSGDLLGTAVDTSEALVADADQDPGSRGSAVRIGLGLGVGHVVASAVAGAVIGARLGLVVEDDGARGVEVEGTLSVGRAGTSQGVVGVVQREASAPGAENVVGVGSSSAGLAVRGIEIGAGFLLGDGDVASGAGPVGLAVGTNGADAETLRADAVTRAVVAVVEADLLSGDEGAASDGVGLLDGRDVSAVADTGSTVALADTAARLGAGLDDTLAVAGDEETFRVDHAYGEQ